MAYSSSPSDVTPSSFQSAEAFFDPSPGIRRRSGSVAGTSFSSEARAGEEPVSTRAVISAAIEAPIPFTETSFPSRTSDGRSERPATAAAAFSKARTLNGFSPFSARSPAIRSRAAETASRSTRVG